MKKTLLSVIAVAFVSVAIISCTSNETKEKSEKNEMEAGVQYTCPMHPEVIADKPGSCPKCGMDLVKKEAEKMETMPDSTMKGDSTMKM